MPTLKQFLSGKFTMLWILICILSIQSFAQPGLPAYSPDCYPSYYKKFKSDQEHEYPTNFALMGNNMQLLATNRYSTLPDGSTEGFSGLKLIDGQGNLLGSADFFHGGANADFSMFKLDDNHVMLVYTGDEAGQKAMSFSLVNANLQKLWTRRIYTQNDFYSAGDGVADIHKDADGNIVILGTAGDGGPNPGSISLYKMDMSGNEMWTSVHQLKTSGAMSGSITSSPAGYIVVTEGYQGNSFLVNKNSGDIIQSYSFPENWSGSVFQRFLEYNNGLAFYAGTDKDNQLMIGRFDSLAKPLGFKFLPGIISIPYADVKDGFFYLNFSFADFSLNSHVIMKLDAELDPVFMNEYLQDHETQIRGIGVGDNGKIYTAGGWGAMGGSTTQTYLMKFGFAGEIGFCGYQPYHASFQGFNPTPGTVDLQRVPRSYIQATMDENLLPSNTTFDIDEVICGEIDLCTDVRIQDPGPVCTLNADKMIQYFTNADCDKNPEWTFDSTHVKFISASAGEAVFQFLKSGPTWLYATIKSDCNIFQDSLRVQVDEQPSSLFLGNDTLICPGDSVLLDAGDNYVQYIWQDGSYEITYQAKTAGVYVVYVSNTCGELSSDEITISTAVLPKLFHVASMAPCANDTFSITADPSYLSYAWGAGENIEANGNKAKANFSSSASIVLAAVSDYGCTAKDTMAINLLFPRPVKLGADTTLCFTDSITFLTDGGYSSYKWSTGSTNSILKVNNPGQYDVTAQDMNGCFARDTVVVKKFNPIIMSIGEDRDLCTNQPVKLDAGAFSAFQWQDGSSSRSINIQAAGTYWVNIRDQNNCFASDTMRVRTVFETPASFLKPIDTICRFRNLELFPTGTYKSYQWNTGATTPRISITNGGTYSLKVTSKDGCAATETITVAEKDCLNGVFMANAFTPNHDGKNDLFKAMVYGPVVKYSIIIFNRYGQVVFSTNDHLKGWDGFFKGMPAENGNYVWKCVYQMQGGQPTDLKGQVLLLR
jgi:gliding motility-associated-like protein